MDAYQAEYRKRNRESRRILSRECRLKKLTHYRARSMESRKAHPEWRKRYYLKYRDKILKSQRANYPKNKEKYRVSRKIYARKNPHISTLGSLRRRARELGTNEVKRGVAIFVKALRSKRTVRCYYCKTFVSGRKAHVEHVIPLAKGGTHNAENLCAACPKCNLTKSTRILGDWQPDSTQPVLAL